MYRKTEEERELLAKIRLFTNRLGWITTGSREFWRAVMIERKVASCVPIIRGNLRGLKNLVFYDRPEQNPTSLNFTLLTNPF